MTEKMPRVAQTPSTNEKDSINANSNKCERSNGHLNLAEDMDRGSKGRIILYDDVTNTDEDESTYSLSRVIDGKVKHFKKDTRVWLHKSSTKCKRKPEENLAKFEDAETPRKLVKFEDDQNTRVLQNQMKEKIQGEENDLSQTDISKTYDGFYKKTSEIVSDMSSLSDSDADLTYSEETTPTKTHSACEESVRTITSQSSTSMVTNDVTSQDDIRLADFDEPKLTDDLEASSESLEVLDLCNQSTNSNQSFPRALSTKCNIEFCPSNHAKAHPNQACQKNRAFPRQLAPAIDIEDESIRENLLDYCVKLTSGDRDQTHCIANRTRSARKSRGGITSSTGGGSKTQRVHNRAQKSNKNKYIKYKNHHHLKADRNISSKSASEPLQVNALKDNPYERRELQSDEKPCCSTQPTITLPMSLLCLATLALLKDTLLPL